MWRVWLFVQLFTKLETMLDRKVQIAKPETNTTLFQLLGVGTTELKFLGSGRFLEFPIGKSIPHLKGDG